MSLPLTVTCFSKIQTGFAFLVPAYLGSPRKMAIKCVCVCVCVCVCAERERKRETDRQKEKQIFSHETSLVGVLMYKAYQSTLEALATMHYTDWCFISHYITFYNLPSVLWHFVRHQEEHPACKKWRHCIPKLHHLLPQLNPDWLYLSGTGLPRLSWKRGR